MVDIEPIAGPFGARVTGFEPAQAGDAAATAPIVAALLEHAVLVVQAGPLEPVHLEAIARALGQPLDEARQTDTGPPGRWVSTGSHRPDPPWCTLRYAVAVPSRGGQSQFADMRAALRLLPPEDRDEAADLRLVHRDSEGGGPGVEHPWIRTLPDGSRSLYMGAHATHIAGGAPDRGDGRQWLAEMTAQIPLHDIVVEHRWQVHDLVIADDRTTLHRALPYDVANERRVIWQISIAGPGPTGV